MIKIIKEIPLELYMGVAFLCDAVYNDRTTALILAAIYLTAARILIEMKGK